MRRAATSVVLLACLFSLVLAANLDEQGNPIPSDSPDPVDEHGRVVYSDAAGELNYEQDPGVDDAEDPVAGDGPVNTPPAGGLVVNDEWQRAIFGTGIGATGMWIVDLDGDGANEVVAGASSGGFGGNTYWYVLSHVGGGYSHEWISTQYSQAITCVRVANVDGDADPDVVIGVGREIRAYDGETRELLHATTTLASSVRGLNIVDVDSDGGLEYVFVDSSALYVIDVATGTQEYRGPGYGGNSAAVGNVDGDAAMEIVVGRGNSTGYVLNGATRAVEWSYPSGFGSYVEVGDLDGDGMDEIAAGQGWYRITTFNADLQSPAWEISTRINIDALKLVDVESDGDLELVYGDGQWGGVHVHDGLTGAKEWSVGNPEHGVTDVAVGDTDGDGTNELLWGAGYSSTGPDYLFVHDTVTRAREWQSSDLVGPFYAMDYGDVDADGRLELLYGSYESDSGYGDGLFFIHDAETKALEYESPEPTRLNWTGLWRVRSANVDADPQHEIFVTTGVTYSGYIIAYDGITHAEEWRFILPSGLSFRSMAVADVNLDGRLEIIAGTRREHTGAPGVFFYILDAATGQEIWHSTNLSVGWGPLNLLRIGQLDTDPQPEIVIGGGGKVFVYDGMTRSEQGQSGALSVTAMDLADVDDDGTNEIIIGTSSGAIQRLRTQDLTVIQTLGQYAHAIEGLRVSDVLLDGYPDYVFGLDRELVIQDGAQAGQVAWQSGSIGSRVGLADSILVADIDGDNSVEIMANIGFGLRIYEIPEAQNHLPIAVAGPDIVAECESNRHAMVTFDGSASSDVDSTPGTNDDIASFEWSENGAVLATGEFAIASLGLGGHDVRLTVTDRGGLRDRDMLRATVQDTLPPTGGITTPAPGACYGPPALPVVIVDSFTDACDPTPQRTYSPPGGEYALHGEHVVTLNVVDQSGNSASDQVWFTIDRISPVCELLSPPSRTLLLPTNLLLPIVFAAHDEDDAAGGVVHEVVKLERQPGGRVCTIYDGWTFGDRDGLLSDETIVLDTAELCRVSQLCGFNELRNPALSVEAADCGGNVGADGHRLRGSIALRPGLCTGQAASDSVQEFGPR